MLSSLHIENFALIESLDIEFPSGLTIITGETGAGKSIMLGALALLMGARADLQARRDPSRRMMAEAVFSGPVPEDLAALLSGADGDEECADTPVETSGYADGIILRREIAPNGRSRAFVNDSPVNLRQLSLIASRLVDIHSQHSNLLMERPGFQLGILDAMGGCAPLLAAYREVFARYASLRRTLRRRREELERSREQEEILSFRLSRLRELRPRAGEQAELERRLEILSAAEEIRESLGHVCRLLDGGEESSLSTLHEARVRLSSVNPAALPEETDADDSLPRRLESAEIEVRDIAATLRDCLDGVEADPARLRRTEARLEAIYAEERRFGVDSDAALADILADLERKAGMLAGGDEDLRSLERDVKRVGQELKEAAAALTAARREAGKIFAAELTEMARPLGLGNLRFEATVEPAQRMAPDGADTPLFLCAFNKNQPLRPVTGIASGGELSRLMLCIKAILAGRMQLPTIIFDEVDTGVSGDIADRMGRLMRLMAAKLQVIAITHLPQVAVMGDVHLKVYKEDSADSTLTHIVRLSETQREREVARMLSGSVIDEAALLNARSLLGRDPAPGPSGVLPLE